MSAITDKNVLRNRFISKSFAKYFAFWGGGSTQWLAYFMNNNVVSDKVLVKRFYVCVKLRHVEPSEVQSKFHFVV